MAGGKKRTGSTKPKSGEKPIDPEGNTFNWIKKGIMEKCRTNLCNFYLLSYKFFT